jgi:hypothetical protein
MLNYKGIFYNEDKEKKFYEGGAHFKYLDLVNALIELIKEKNNNIDDDNSKNKSEDLVSLNNEKIINSFDKEKYSTKISKEKKINSNLITINNYKIHNNIKIINNRKHILSTDKNIEKEKAKKKKLLELLNYNIKISPYKNNHSIANKIFSNNSINKISDRKSLKLIVNNENYNDSKNYLSLHIINKKTDGNNLPLIQSSYFNNVSNKNMLGKKINVYNSINNKADLKHISKFTLNKTKISKDNLFLKNKLLSPIKSSKNRNNIFSNDLLESQKNSKNYGTINILTKKNRNFDPGKMAKFFNNKQKKNMNINVNHFDFNKNG